MRILGFEKTQEETLTKAGVVDFRQSLYLFPSSDIEKSRIENGVSYGNCIFINTVVNKFNKINHDKMTGSCGKLGDYSLLRSMYSMEFFMPKGAKNIGQAEFHLEESVCTSMLVGKSLSGSKLSPFYHTKLYGDFDEDRHYAFAHYGIERIEVPNPPYLNYLHQLMENNANTWRFEGDDGIGPDGRYLCTGEQMIRSGGYLKDYHVFETKKTWRPMSTDLSKQFHTEGYSSGHENPFIKVYDFAAQFLVENFGYHVDHIAYMYDTKTDKYNHKLLPNADSTFWVRKYYPEDLGMKLGDMAHNGFITRARLMQAGSCHFRIYIAALPYGAVVIYIPYSDSGRLMSEEKIRVYIPMTDLISLANEETPYMDMYG